MEPLNSSNIGEQIPALLPQQNKKAIVIILSSISLVLLLVSIFLFVLLGQTKAKMQGEINTAQNDLKNLKESSEKEILSLKKEIEKIKNPTRINTEETSIEKSPDSRDKKRISDL